MLNDTVHINAPDTQGPIEEYMQYKILNGSGDPASRILVDELLNPLTDENGVELMR